MSQPDPAQSKLYFGNRHQALADGESAIAIKVRLRDFKGRPVPGRLVELAADRAGVAIEQPGPTDNTGLALGYVRATTPGPVNISGTVLPEDEAGSSSTALI